MALTYTPAGEIGFVLPDFQLPTVDGKMCSRQDFLAKVVVIAFICNHCPFVIHVRKQLSALGTDYLPKGLGIVAINSNDTLTHPDDSPEKMKIEHKQADYTFPYLFDATQNVAKDFKAACTPDIYLFDKEHRLVYRGQLDDSRPSNQIPVTGKDLRAAIEALLTGVRISAEQKPSLGCNIKWKLGNEPKY
jgi:peroxiredoxin